MITPQPPPRPDGRRSRAADLRARVAATAVFVAGWAFLNVVLNLRYPAAEPGPPLWCLLPSLDVTALLIAFALLGWMGRRIPRWGLAVITAVLVAVRIFRFGDGLVRDGWGRPINLSLDLALLPDLARLLRSTVAPSTWFLGIVIGVAVIGLLIFLIHVTVTRMQRDLALAPRRIDLAVLTALAALASPTWKGGQRMAGGHVGLFGASVVPRLVEQVRFVADVRVLREAKAREIAAAQLHLAQIPSGLEKLAGSDVLLFFIESYGHTVFTNPQQARLIEPVHHAFAAQLDRLGMTVATGQLASPVQGGGSWMAHATFAAGVRIGDGLEFALLRQTKPPPTTMAVFFRRAGYRTVLVQPGTTRPWPEGEVTGFDSRYYAPDLAYQGPAFEWAPMPDQYVIDFVARREITTGVRAPLFAEFALVSSHAPWSLQPPVVDWAQLKAGAIYNRVPPIHFPMTWQTLAQGSEAYVASLGYDFTILGQYLPQLARPDSLIIILGDHQPHAAVTGAPPTPEIPVHVISRNRALVNAFIDDKGEGGGSGFVLGMRPPLGTAAPKMETFLADLLRRLSRARPAGAVTVTAKAPAAAPATTAAP
jgi:hypothetical protein